MKIPTSTRFDEELYEQMSNKVKSGHFHSISDLVRASVDHYLNQDNEKPSLELCRTLLQTTANIDSAITAMETYLPSPKNNTAIKNLKESKENLCKFYLNI